MTDTQPTAGRTWRYRFSQPGDAEVEVGELPDDQAADRRARELSRALLAPIIVHRQDLVDWEYVIEVDERP